MSQPCHNHTTTMSQPCNNHLTTLSQVFISVTRARMGTATLLLRGLSTRECWYGSRGSRQSVICVAAGGSRSDIVTSVVQVNISILVRVKDPVNTVSANKACGLLGITSRNFYRKNKKAELFLLNSSLLDALDGEDGSRQILLQF